MGLRPVLDHQHDRGLRLQPEKKARSRWRTRAPSIGSGAGATPPAYSRLPIRWRLAGGSALLTLVILCGFAAIVGVLTTGRIRDGFNREVVSSADTLEQKLRLRTGYDDNGRT